MTTQKVLDTLYTVPTVSPGTAQNYPNYPTQPRTCARDERHRTHTFSMWTLFQGMRGRNNHDFNEKLWLITYLQELFLKGLASFFCTPQYCETCRSSQNSLCQPSRFDGRSCSIMSSPKARDAKYSPKAFPYHGVQHADTAFEYHH